VKLPVRRPQYNSPETLAPAFDASLIQKVEEIIKTTPAIIIEKT
jgi:hypothetical protein